MKTKFLKEKIKIVLTMDNGEKRACKFRYTNKYGFWYQDNKGVFIHQSRVISTKNLDK